jgi:hypothetical protein
MVDLSSRPLKRLCESCGSRAARNHLCQIIDGQQTSFDLCDVCIRGHSAQRGFEFPVLDGTQRCYYCDGPATSAGTNLPWERAIRQERFYYSCFRCAHLQHQFTKAALSTPPENLSQDVQLQHIEKIIRDVDQRVRDRVRSDSE